MSPAQLERVPHLIVGAGPAGLQLGYFLQKKKRQYVMLERRPYPGMTFATYPRHGKMISINKVHTGYQDRESQLRYDWNSLLCDDPDFCFPNYTKAYFPDKRHFVRYLADFAARFSLNIRYERTVEKISKAPGGEFVVEVSTGERFLTPSLIIATGIANPYLPPIPGIELTENYATMSIDPEDYAEQRVLILGKGNSAFETANHITGTARVIHILSPNPLKMAWRTHFFGHLRAVNNEFLDTYILKGQNSVLNAEVRSIRKVQGEYRVKVAFTRAAGQEAEFGYDRVLCCTGFQFDRSVFAPDCRPDLTKSGRLPLMTSRWESTNLPGLFYAGTLTQSRDYQKTMSSVLHGFRFNAQALFHFLEERYYREAIPSVGIPLDPQRLADHIIHRVSSCAGLMHQPGFLGDWFRIRPEKNDVTYHDALPVDYLLEGLSKDGISGIVTLEYGHFEGDIFATERVPDPSKAYDDAYLHPRIRWFQDGKLVAEHHMSESLENDWRPGEHPGERALIREFKLVGHPDPTAFNQIHRDQLVQFLDRQISWSDRGFALVREDRMIGKSEGVSAGARSY